jgi:cell fate (sporulation/competence/biofilm development) regulator YlbF (YheA/YmcA/DUF963 family)
MDIIEKARELGQMLAASKEMTAYNDSDAAMQADVKSTTLMSEYKQLQIEMVRLTKSGAEAQAIEEAKLKLLNKQQEINEYPVTMNYLTSKANLEALMKRVNDILIYSITGEPQCSDDKCKSCGGGCRG